MPKNNYNWGKFIQATKKRKPIGFLTEAVEKLEKKEGLILDLGCGAGVDAKYLGRNGFKVEAVDLDTESIINTKKICRKLPVKIIRADVTDYKIEKDRYILIFSWNLLSFLNKKDAESVLQKIKKGLKNGGFFVFSVFGPEDDWAKSRPEMSFWEIEKLKKILVNFRFVKILEEKERKPGATGKVKFWHTIKIISQKKK